MPPELEQGGRDARDAYYLLRQQKANPPTRVTIYGRLYISIKETEARTCPNSPHLLTHLIIIFAVHLPGTRTAGLKPMDWCDGVEPCGEKVVVDLMWRGQNLRREGWLTRIMAMACFGRRYLFRHCPLLGNFASRRVCGRLFTSIHTLETTTRCSAILPSREGGGKARSLSQRRLKHHKLSLTSTDPRFWQMFLGHTVLNALRICNPSYQKRSLWN